MHQNGVGNGAVSVSGGMAARYRSGHLVRRGALDCAQRAAGSARHHRGLIERFGCPAAIPARRPSRVLQASHELSHQSEKMRSQVETFLSSIKAA